MNGRTFWISLTVITLSCLMTGCGTGAFQIQMVPSKQELTETVLKKDAGLFVRDKILIIDVDGVIANEQQNGFLQQGDNPVSTFLEKLDKARADDDVKAVVLRINSPGGTVAGTDMMYHCLTEYKQKTQVPVVACMLDVAASGGYYLACGCDGIVAQPSTVTGSIGTIMQTISVAGTMDKLGIEAVAIKSGKMKDIGSPLHEMSEEEQALLQQIIDGFYEQFLGVVQAGRADMTKNKIRRLADGRVFTADQAKQQGLVDRIGYPDDAIAWARELAGIKKAKVVIYHRPMNTMSNVYGSAMSTSDSPLVNIDLPDWLDAGRTQFLYLWQPGL